MTKFESLPLFEVPVFLLPDGFTRLRVFEPHYLKLISIASRSDGFVISSKDGVHQNASWGSWVEIINFDQANDGILEVDVKCKCLVETLVNSQYSINNESKLKYVKVYPFTSWVESDVSIDVSTLITELAKVISRDTVLSELYPEIRNKKSCWYVARWLELLPISSDTKSDFVFKYGHKEANDFIRSIIFK